MNIELGKYNKLTVVKEVDFGVYLDGGEEGEILLPTRYVPEGLNVGDEIEVFIYLDIDERTIATTLHPYAQVGEFACLEVAWVNEFGAFLDWGLMKDLFVPFREQKMRMDKGRKYVVYVMIDSDSYRIMGTAKVDKYLSKEFPKYKSDQEVDMMVWQRTELGFKVIIDNKYAGLIYSNEVFQPLETGMKLKGYIKNIREDGKIDASIQKVGVKGIEDFSATLLGYLKENGGHTNLHDKSDPEDIYDTFGVSKKIFKKGVGDLYKRHLIRISDDGIYLI